ncbi:MAG: aldolase/citrate lyase family protein [Hyphomicrobiales bacterium]
MIKNELKRRWAADEPTINGWLSIGNPFTAEIMAAQGYDSLTVDVQHGALDYANMLAMFQAMRASGVVPMARVPWLEPGAIMKAMDGGAYGIICPMVNNAAEAAQLVEYMRYPPHGLRSFGPTRVNFSAGQGYAAEANDEILCIAMIETAEAVKNLEAIAATPGIDGLYVGPADLTLGVTNGRLAPGFDREEPEMVEVIQRIAKVAKANAIIAGIQCGSESYAAKAIGWGYSMVTLTNDVRLLATGARQSVSNMHALLGRDKADADTNAKGGY